MIPKTDQLFHLKKKILIDCNVFTKPMLCILDSVDRRIFALDNTIDLIVACKEIEQVKRHVQSIRNMPDFDILDLDQSSWPYIVLLPLNINNQYILPAVPHEFWRKTVPRLVSSPGTFKYFIPNELKPYVIHNGPKSWGFKLRLEESIFDEYFAPHELFQSKDSDQAEQDVNAIIMGF